MAKKINCPKNRKHFIFCTLVLSLTVSLFVSCGSGKKEQLSSGGSSLSSRDKTQTVSSEAEIIEEPPKIDLNGYEFVILDCTRYGDYELPAEGTSAMADELWGVIREVEGKLNCKISYKFYDPTGSFDTIFPSIMAGEKLGDVIMTTTFMYGSYVNSDTLIDLNTVPGLKLDSKYWNQSVNKALTIRGKTLGTSNDLAYYGQKVSGMLYNRSMIKQLGLEDPYDLVKANKWTYEKFRDMCKAATKDLNGDGKMTDVDRYGIVGSYFIRPLYDASGSRILTVGNDGLVKFAMNNSQAISSLNFIRDIYQNNNLFYKLGEGQPWMKWYEMFSNGQALFNGCAIMDAQYTRDMNDEKGFVVTPKGPDAKDYTSSIEGNATVMGILKSNKDLDKTGPIMEAMAYLSSRVGVAYQNDLYEIYLEGDEKSIEMHELAMQKQVFDLCEFRIPGESYSTLYDSVMGAEAPGQVVQSRAEMIQTGLDNAYNNRFN